MKRLILWLAALGCVAAPGRSSAENKELFPDGTPISEWFSERPAAPGGTRYALTDYGVVRDSTLVQTAAIQAVIDRAAVEGGTVVVPQGVFLSGALFFRPGTHLLLEEGAVLKGSDDIADFPVVDTRIEGRSVRYFAALVNADGVDGFTLTGRGTIDGNGLRYWRAFWLRRQWNPKCTNMDEMRPRLIYVSNSSDVMIEGLTLRNSPFWTTHLYRCNRVKLMDLHISSPATPVKAPSTDAIDIDACHYIHVDGCYLSVNDDAIALKGGKGPWADQDPDNGGNSEILIENCTFGFSHSALTCGSESIHNRNILMRRCKVHRANRLLWLKMRPDTPQLYEYVTVEDIEGDAGRFLVIRPWTQFFNPEGRDQIPVSRAEHITMRNIRVDCETFFDVKPSPEQYQLSDFTFERLKIRALKPAYDRSYIERFVWNDVKVSELKAEE